MLHRDPRPCKKVDSGHAWGPPPPPGDSDLLGIFSEKAQKGEIKG